MATFFFFIVSLYAACAAPQSRLYHQAAQYQQINPLDYYLDNPEARNYYEQDQKQVNANSHNAPARLETLEPDSEVELIPGAQQPQQPPQQTPVAPNIPGLIPGQRVFIVHMPVPGYRPGTVGGYQPVYVVAAAPQANAGYPGSGYQNPVLLDPSGQGAPVLGYQPGAPGVQANPNFAVPFGNRPFNFGYQAPIIAYQPITKNQGEVPGALRLSQLVSLQGQVHQTNEGHQNNENLSKAEPKNASQVTMESKQQAQNSKQSLAQIKNKA